eukprot:NODE_1210_length_1783_cov_0.026128.p4 type:complete len:109 gc:universal NODE_1210_length_1783_cov_0.026128:314-640(+)
MERPRPCSSVQLLFTCMQMHAWMRRQRPIGAYLPLARPQREHERRHELQPAPSSSLGAPSLRHALMSRLRLLPSRAASVHSMSRATYWCHSALRDTPLRLQHSAVRLL